jgi:C4-dicarboxylate-specific signal transduction histidine kinase
MEVTLNHLESQTSMTRERLSSATEELDLQHVRGRGASLLSLLWLPLHALATQCARGRAVQRLGLGLPCLTPFQTSAPLQAKIAEQERQLAARAQELQQAQQQLAAAVEARQRLEQQLAGKGSALAGPPSPAEPPGP